jgi:TPR repeat protein
LAALSLLPIDECDLLASSLADNLRVGPGNFDVLFRQPNLRQRALRVCQRAVERERNNGRYWYELGRIETYLNPKKAHQDSGIAAGLGYPAGYHSLGYDFDNGVGVDIDLDQAESNYRIAVSLGNSFSLLGLADVAYERQQWQSEYDYLKRYYAVGGSQLAKMADMYDRDDLDFMRKDIPKYVELLEEGVKRGDGISAFQLANLLTKQDPQRANDLFEKSVQLSMDGDAAAKLAFRYEVGLGREKDLAKATYWAIFGAKLTNGLAQRRLFELIQSGKAVFKQGYAPPSSFDELAILIPAAKMGDREAEYQLAQALEKRGKLSDAKSWYLSAASHGQSDAKDALEHLESGAKREIPPTGQMPRN